MCVLTDQMILRSVNSSVGLTNIQWQAVIIISAKHSYKHSWGSMKGTKVLTFSMYYSCTGCMNVWNALLCYTTVEDREEATES